MAGEAKINDQLQQKLKNMWHPTAEWCYFVAIVLTRKFPRKHQGIVPGILRIIREMLPSSKLTKLSLSGHQIRDAGAIKLAEMLPSSKLTHLQLSYNPITDAGAIKLAEILPSSKLTKLSLTECVITDAGAIKFAEMLPSSKLTYLNFNGNPITDAGKAAFGKIKNKDGKKIQVYGFNDKWSISLNRRII